MLDRLVHPPMTPDQFQEARRIRDMFFPPGAKMPDVRFFVTFGNLDGKTLFVAACEAVYKVRLKSAGPVPGIVIRH